MRPPIALSLRTRLIGGLLLCAAVLIAVAAIITTTTRTLLIDQVDTQLLAAAANGTPRSQPPDAELPPGGPEDAPQIAAERLSALFVGTLLPDGTLIPVYRSDLTSAPFEAPDVSSLGDVQPAKIVTVASVDGEIRYRLTVTTGPDGPLVQALPLDNVDSAVTQLKGLLAIGVAIVLAMLAAVAWWVIHLGLRPIKQMTATAIEIADGDLTARVPTNAPPGTESNDLARSLNHMLSKLHDAAQAQIESEDRLRRFVADASHELRTPITTIRGYAELYRHGGLASSESLDDAMRRTEQESQRMGRLVDEMLTLAKLDEGRPLDFRPTDLTRLLLDNVADTSVTAPDRVITAAVDPGLTVAGDNDRLRQVIANIVANAIVHTPPGTPITIGGRRVGENIVIEIIDAGPGMSPAVAARVTERFYRADVSRTRDRGGSGLGLSIADAIVRAHDGEITLESSELGGTTVRIRLPTC